MPFGKRDLAKLLKVLSKDLASREWCQSIKSSTRSPQIIGSQGLNSGSIPHVASQNNNQNPPKITCTYFRQNHPSNCCPVVTNVLAWKKTLEEKSKCYIVLKLDTQLKIAHLKIVVLLIKSNSTFLLVDLKLILLWEISQVKTRHLKMKL